MMNPMRWLTLSTALLFATAAFGQEFGTPGATKSTPAGVENTEPGRIGGEAAKERGARARHKQGEQRGKRRARKGKGHKKGKGAARSGRGGRKGAATRGQQNDISRTDRPAAGRRGALRSGRGGSARVGEKLKQLKDLRRQRAARVAGLKRTAGIKQAKRRDPKGRTGGTPRTRKRPL